jgi:RES domain-containing protein
VNLSGLASMPTTPLTQRVWYRAIAVKFLPNPLGYSHTIGTHSRFSNKGRYPLLYLAPDPTTAMFEVQAFLGSMYGRWVAHMASNWIPVPVSVGSMDVFDFGHPARRTNVDMTIQELTGDWWGYRLRQVLNNFPVLPATTPPHNISAPTQELGREIAHLKPQRVSGFLAPSARNTLVTNLVLLPDQITTRGEVTAKTPDGVEHDLLDADSN